MVAIIVYNGQEKWNPAVMLALVAMKYAFDADKYRETFDEAVQYVLKLDSKNSIVLYSYQWSVVSF